MTDSGTLRYLALDQSPKLMGAAIGHKTMSGPTCLTVDLSPDPKHMVLKARDWLAFAFKFWAIDRVVYEEPFKGENVGYYGLANQLIGVIRLTCADRDIPYMHVAPSKWRLRFLGCDKAPKSLKNTYRKQQWLKDQAIQQCVARHWSVENHHEAEACGILDWILALDHRDYGTTIGAPLFK